MEQSLHTAQHSHRVAAEAVIGGGGGDRKLAVGSEGVVGSSSAPSVCGIPPQAGDEGMSGVVLSSEASAIGEITILRFLLLLVCTPVCGVPAAAEAAAASGREVDVACAALTPTLPQKTVGELQLWSLAAAAVPNSPAAAEHAAAAATAALAAAMVAASAAAEAAPPAAAVAAAAG